MTRESMTLAEARLLFDRCERDGDMFAWILDKPDYIDNMLAKDYPDRGEAHPNGDEVG